MRVCVRAHVCVCVCVCGQHPATTACLIADHCASNVCGLNAWWSPDQKTDAISERSVAGVKGIVAVGVKCAPAWISCAGAATAVYAVRGWAPEAATDLHGRGDRDILCIEDPFHTTNNAERRRIP